MIIAFMTMLPSITLQAELQRKDPQLPVFIVIPYSVLQVWDPLETTIVEGIIEGYETGRRTIKRMKNSPTSDWFMELTLPFCRVSNIKVGDTLDVSIKLANTDIPVELDVYLSKSPKLKAKWDQLSEYVRRTSQEHILQAKTQATRESRAVSIVERLSAP